MMWTICKDRDNKDGVGDGESSLIDNCDYI